MRIWHIIGIMSGTSLDGLDVAYCSFWFNKKWKYKIIVAQTYKYSKQWKQKLSNAHNLNAYDFLLLHNEYGKFIGKIINKFIKENNIKKIDFISSHGHTIFHEPHKNLNFQLGNGAYIASVTKKTTICDFRTFDIALGGQGAPLVPIGDHLLFPEFDYCLNIGGIANVSYIENNKRIAFDICPANFLLNYYANKLNYTFDPYGNMAKKGRVIPNLLKQLNSLPYYQKKHPKSLARENIEKDYLPIINKFYNFNEHDILATITEHISTQISLVLKHGTTLVTGGGAFNKFLIEKIISKSNSKIIIPSDALIKYKESLIFAFLGLLRHLEKNNCLKSVTGALKDSCSGIIFVY
ncbi:MAG: anhydro-N-acetylmuramic acid kinase [Bacteroidales bacterium]|nr:anhydro-N-acetylmuramic acid kinase [Bacteroidales bacterium]